MIGIPKFTILRTTGAPKYLGYLVIIASTGYLFRLNCEYLQQERMNLSIHDALEWTIENGRIVVSPLGNGLLQYRNSIKVGAGNIDEDIDLARQIRVKKEV